MTKTLLLLVGTLCIAGCARDRDAAGKGEESEMTIEITSPAFEEGQSIPARYTDDGVNISPPLNWKGLPEEAKSLAIIADDPDAPAKTWVHWVVYNISPESSGLDEGMAKDEKMPDGTMQGMTDFGSVGYGGPAPPSGTHRYFFKIYALDKKLDMSPGAAKDELLKAMGGHIIAQGQLMGTYSRE
ncbi:putative kinase inhibitor protein [Anaerohalosphaera lusitana]|uniref:Putative kinase inhibitor protein n=1 Tax=Anaerohalosphaera lusitana TaxID=1936003 RepID=A0A1U9NQ93_9BACT|nr:YbhB/YbcL family Raf kinase inhibitor-like protein [Anaerohalosphaera lusitana]AQT70103.1 putative kinase inhibitor protein [Anaerohalosphaera lusitana]